MPNIVQYPFAGFNLEVPELKRKVLVHIVASNKNYAAIMPLDQLADLPNLVNDKDVCEIVLQVVADSFESMVEVYLAECAKNNCVFQFPEAPKEKIELVADECVISFLLAIPAKDDKPEGSFSLNGKYLFICEDNVNVNDFLPGTESSPTLH